MKKEFSMSNDKVMINFTAKYCSTFDAILESNGFRRILEIYLKRAKKKNTISYKYLTENLKTDSIMEMRRELTQVIKYLTIMSVEEILEYNTTFEALLHSKDSFINFIEELYLFWRKLERYTVIHRYKIQQGLAAVSFTEANANFSKLILKLYRKVEKNILGHEPQVF